jgi:hypothetical protein
VRRSGEEPVEPVRRLALERRGNVAVGVERHRDLGVPEPLLDDLGVDARPCRPTVASTHPKLSVSTRNEFSDRRLSKSDNRKDKLRFGNDR